MSFTRKIVASRLQELSARFDEAEADDREQKAYDSGFEDGEIEGRINRSNKAHQNFLDNYRPAKRSLGKMVLAAQVKGERNMGECRCTGHDGKPKIRFFSRREAKNAIKKYHGNNKIRPYRCPDSEFFHATSTPTAAVTYYRERGMS